MSEEEIVKNIKHIIRYWKPPKDVDELAELEYKSIKGLLDLYNKEKEKNKAKNQKIVELNNLLGEFIDNSIEKDKIREKIEELKEKEQELTDEQGYWGGRELQIKIELLEGLLEE